MAAGPWTTGRKSCPRSAALGSQRTSEDSDLSVGITGGLVKTQALLRVGDSVGLGWGPIVCFLTSPQGMLLLDPALRNDFGGPLHRPLPVCPSPKAKMSMGSRTHPFCS